VTNRVAHLVVIPAAPRALLLFPMTVILRARREERSLAQDVIPREGAHLSYEELRHASCFGMPLSEMQHLTGSRTCGKL
jgi:hypothetical protein